jgi:hypothetical protein
VHCSMQCNVQPICLRACPCLAAYVPPCTGPGAAETGAGPQTSRKRGAQDVEEDTGKHIFHANMQ